MLTLDASSLIYAWDIYPITQFPKVWKWIEDKCESGDFQIAQPAFEEVENKIPEFGKLLKAWGMKQITPDNEILAEALRIQQLLGIANDEYHPRGVGENDIVIIATARIFDAGLVTEESRQAIPPVENKKLKIPGACQLPGVKVTCKNFLELLVDSNRTFG